MEDFVPSPESPVYKTPEEASKMQCGTTCADRCSGSQCMAWRWKDGVSVPIYLAGNSALGPDTWGLKKPTWKYTVTREVREPKGFCGNPVSPTTPPKDPTQ